MTNTPSSNINMTSTELEKSFILEEYKALRDEIILLMNKELQVINIYITSAGVLLTFGIQQNSSMILFVQPILTVFLASQWTQSVIGVQKLGEYIRNNIESHVSSRLKFWETQRNTDFRVNKFTYRMRGLDIMALLIFMLPSFISYSLGFGLSKGTAIELFLGIIATMSIGFTLLLFINCYMVVRKSIA